MRLYRRAVPADWALVGDIYADARGTLTYEDLDTQPGRSYEYQIGLLNGRNETILGRVWVDVPAMVAFALRSLSGNPAHGLLQFSVKLPSNGRATLELIDVTGRRIARKELSLGAGEHQVRLDAKGAASGVYWARLLQSGKMITTRVSLVH